MADPAYLRVKDVARKYQISPKFIYEKIEAGIGPRIHRVGTRMIRIRPEDFEEWIGANPERK
jgi:predicted DNA-binding transcriptional regulator AlpA